MTATADRATIATIYSRYTSMCRTHGTTPADRLDVEMTLFFANEQYPLDFERLATFKDFDFAHDVFGMLRHMDRPSCKLQNFFVPRCAK